MKAAVSGLYAVTPDIADTAELLVKVEAALAGGSGLLQYRNKTASAALRLEQARALCVPCRRRGVPLIINDHLELATAVDADGPRGRVATMAGGLAAFVLLLPWLGYPVVSFGLVALLLRRLGGMRWTLTLATALLSAAGSHYVFAVLLSVPLPRGLFAD